VFSISNDPSNQNQMAVEEQGREIFFMNGYTLDKCERNSSHRKVNLKALPTEQAKILVEKELDDVNKSDNLSE